MSEISLRDYLAKLDNLLNANSADEVIQHCRHILQYFPKNVSAYRYLGRALVENGRWEEATSALQRVLSVVPDDFVAHVGLSEAMERTNHPEDAIWHLERAFEQHPADKNILEQLRLLYSQHHGVENAKIPLTAVAVARQALKTQSYVQAADTLRGALLRSAQRVDLRLLLAEVLWEAEFRLEAAELAMDVLEKLPDCLSANRIMAGLWLTEGRPTDAQRYINHLESVDPYLAVELVTGEPVEDNAFRLEELDFRSAAKSAVVAEDNPDWLAGITTPTSGATTRTAEFEALAHDPPADDQWDQWVSAMLQGTPKPVEKPAPSPKREWPEAEQPTLDSGELNPFHVNSTGELDEIDTIFQTGTFGEESGFETEDPMAWLRERGLEIEEDAEVISPAAALLSDTDDEFVMPEPDDPTAWMGRYNLEMSDEPDNLFGDDEPLTSIGSPDLSDADDSLDWLTAAAPTGQPAEDDDSSALLDWSEEPAAEPPPVTNTLDASAESPRPRRGLTAMFNDASFDWNLPTATEDEADDEWSAQFDDKKKASAVTTTNPDWLSGLDDAGFGLDMPDTGTLTWGNEVPQSGGDEMPDNTSGFNADANDNDDAFSWMDDMDGASSSDDQPVSAEVPDWLSELKPADEAGGSSDDSDENDLGWMSSISGSDDDEEASGGIDEEFAWMDETSEEPAATPTDSPDWLAAAAPAAPATSTADDAFDWMNGIDFGDESAKSSEPVPDWLNETEASIDFETPADVHATGLFDNEPAATTADDPSWMSEFGDFAAPANPDADFPNTDAPEAAPDWLSDLEAAAPPTATPAAADVSALDDDTSWMSDFGDLRQEVEAEFTPPVPVAETSPNWLSEFEAETGAEPTDESADDFGLDFEDAVATEETPDWLSEIKPKTAPVADDLSWMDAMAEASARPSEAAPAAESTPDWLSELEPEATADDEDEFPVADAVLTDTPDWLSALEPQAEPEADEEFALDAEAEAVADTPDWLSALEPQAEVEPEADEEFALDPEVEAIADTPDWLSALEPQAEPEADEEFALDAEAEAETPDWLSEFAPVAETPAETVSAPTSAADDLSWMDAFSDDPVEEEAQAEPAAETSPDWLSELEPEAPAVTEVTVTETPDWLSELAPESEPAVESAVTAQDADWLGELSLEAEAPAEPAAEAAPDWLSELEPETEAAPAQAEVDTPDWLTETEPETWPTPQAEPVAEAEADWLTDLGLEPAAEAEVELEAEAEAVAADGTPDWLSALDPGADSELEAELDAQPADEADVDWLPELNTPATTEFDAFNMPLSEVDAMSAPTSTPNAEIDWISELEPEIATEDEDAAVPASAEELASLFDAEPEAEALPDAPETAFMADESAFDADILPYTPDDAVIAATPEEEFAAAALPAEDVIPVLDAEAVPSAVTEPDVITEHSDAEADNTPDWLNAMVPGLDVDYAPTETVEEETHEVEEASPREFAWLNNMVDEELAEAASSFTFSKTPAWLDRLIPPAQPAAPQPDEDFPDWVSDDDEADLPEWLR